MTLETKVARPDSTARPSLFSQALAKKLPGSRLHVLDLSQNAIGERGGEVGESTRG